MFSTRPSCRKWLKQNNVPLPNTIHQRFTRHMYTCRNFQLTAPSIPSVAAGIVTFCLHFIVCLLHDLISPFGILADHLIRHWSLSSYPAPIIHVCHWLYCASVVFHSWDFSSQCYKLLFPWRTCPHFPVNWFEIFFPSCGCKDLNTM